MVEPVRTREEGNNFSRFVRTSFMDGPLDNKLHEAPVDHKHR